MNLRHFITFLGGIAFAVAMNSCAEWFFKPKPHAATASEWIVR